MHDVSSRLRRLMPPEGEPVSLGEAKLFLRVEHDAEDATIARTITAAREACEQYLGLSLLPQTWELDVACRGQRSVVLPFGPVEEVTAVTPLADGAEAMEEALYRLSLDGMRLHFTVPLRGTAVRVAYRASLAEAADALPALLKQGILHHVAAMYAGREGAEGAIPAASLVCYQPFRQVRL